MLAGTERAYKNWVNSKFSALHVKSSDSTEAENYKDLYGKNKSFHPVTVEWFSIQIQPWLGGKNCFSLTNASNFQAVAITAYEICGKKFIGYPTEYTLLVHTNKFCNREWFSRLQKVDHMTN